jgi:alpha-ketoglutarate-dependent taurine dioxygenase
LSEFKASKKPWQMSLTFLTPLSSVIVKVTVSSPAAAATLFIDLKLATRVVPEALASTPKNLSALNKASVSSVGITVIVTISPAAKSKPFEEAAAIVKSFCTKEINQLELYRYLIHLYRQ